MGVSERKERFVHAMIQILREASKMCIGVVTQLVEAANGNQFEHLIHKYIY